MNTFPIAPVLAVIAMLLALLAMLDIVKGDVALGIAIIFLALAVLVPGVLDMAGSRGRVRDRV